MSSAQCWTFREWRIGHGTQILEWTLLSIWRSRQHYINLPTRTPICFTLPKSLFANVLFLYVAAEVSPIPEQAPSKWGFPNMACRQNNQGSRSLIQISQITLELCGRFLRGSLETFIFLPMGISRLGNIQITHMLSSLLRSLGSEICH